MSARIPQWTLIATGLSLALSPVGAKPVKKAIKPAKVMKKAPVKPAPAKVAAAGPKIGTKAPDFTLYGGDEKTATLSDYRGRWVVLNFYPANFTKGCTAQVCGIRDQKADIEALNARPIAVSVQDLASHKKFREDNNLNFPVLSDDHREVAKRYNVLASPDGVAKRYTFYIDPVGVIRRVDDKVQPFSAVKDILTNLNDLQKGETKPSLAASAKFDPIIKQASDEVRKNPNDKEAAADLATALYLKGHYTMMDTWLSPGLRNPAAAQLFDQALKVNPNLVAAQEDKAALAASNKSASSG